MAKLSRALACKRDTALRYLAAAAMHCCRGQQHNLEQTLLYTVPLVRSGVLHPICFAQLQSYDETPSRVRVSWSTDTHAESQIAKLYVVKSQWIMMFYVRTADGEEPFLFHGSWAATLRAGTGTSAADTAAVLATCPEVNMETFKQVGFPITVKVSETDSLAANFKCERLRALADPESWWLHIVCMAHRCHTVADKVFALNRPLLSGICPSLLVLQGSGHLVALRNALMQIVEARLECVPYDGPLAVDVGSLLTEMRARVLASSPRGGRCRLGQPLVVCLLRDDYQSPNVSL